MGPESDIDLLIVLDDAPRGRTRRLLDFDAVEGDLEAALRTAAADAVHTSLSPVIKTREEVLAGSPLFLDMVDRSTLLVDRDGFMRSYLDQLGRRLQQLGARRVYRGGGYYWLLKPDLAPGHSVPL